MNDDDENLTAAEYVLGTLEADERYEFEVKLGREPALRELVETWERDLAPLLTCVPEVTPSPEIWSRIERRIAAGDSASEAIRTVRKTDAAWIKFVPGIEKKQLHIDRIEKVQSYLLRFAPGASLPPHNHKLAEECIVLEGEVSLAGEILSAGDFQLLPADSRHVEMFSAGGAVVYVHGEIDGPIWDMYRFARNLGAMFGR